MSWNREKARFLFSLNFAYLLCQQFINLVKNLVQPHLYRIIININKVYIAKTSRIRDMLHIYPRYTDWHLFSSHRNWHWCVSSSLPRSDTSLRGALLFKENTKRHFQSPVNKCGGICLWMRRNFVGDKCLIARNCYRAFGQYGEVYLAKESIMAFLSKSYQ